MASKNELITVLAQEIIDDAELARGSVTTLVLKASRLARLVGDEEAISWLGWERTGYVDTPKAHVYMVHTARWMDYDTKQALWGTIAEQEGILETGRMEIEALRGFQPAGESAAWQQDAHHKKLDAISNNIQRIIAIVARVRGMVQDFATRVYYEALFGGVAESLFEQYRTEVDATLSATAGDVFNKFPHVFERLAAGDTEAVSHALTSCRRIIDGLADALYPARDETALIGQEAVAVGSENTKNRLRVYVYDRIGKGSRYDRISKAISLLRDRVSAGVHDDVTPGEARSLVLQTYLLAGEILSLPKPAN